MYLAWCDFWQPIKSSNMSTSVMSSNDAAVLSRIITGDESWIYGYDPETKQQFS
jgi:hypothetical protein